jgi:hypothetical protein
MNTRVLVILSLLVGIGTVLHAVVPPFYSVLNQICCYR